MCTIASARLGLNRGSLSGWRQTGCNLAQHFKVDGSLHHLHLIPHSMTTTLDDYYYYYYLSLDKQNDMESNSPRIHHVISTGTLCAGARVSGIWFCISQNERTPPQLIKRWTIWLLLLFGWPICIANESDWCDSQRHNELITQICTKWSSLANNYENAPHQLRMDIICRWLLVVYVEGLSS